MILYFTFESSEIMFIKNFPHWLSIKIAIAHVLAIQLEKQVRQRVHYHYNDPLRKVADL